MIVCVVVAGGNPVAVARVDLLRPLHLRPLRLLELQSLLCTRETCVVFSVAVSHGLSWYLCAHQSCVACFFGCMPIRSRPKCSSMVGSTVAAFFRSRSSLE